MSPFKRINRSDLNKALPPTPPAVRFATATEHNVHSPAMTDDLLIYVVLDTSNDDQLSPFDQAKRTQESTRIFSDATSAWEYAVQCGKSHGVGVTLTAPAPGDANYLEYLNVAGVLCFTTTINQALKLETPKPIKPEVQSRWRWQPRRSGY